MKLILSNIRLWINLTLQMTKRGIQEQYRGTFFGVLWPFISPILMLSVYTFVFTKIIPIRWNEGGESLKTIEFALVLFYGLSVHTFFVTVVMQSTTIIKSNVNYIKKIVFPTFVLPLTATLIALFHLIVSLLVIVSFQGLILGQWTTTTPVIVIIVFPYLMMTLGLAWIVAALGTFLRDLPQIVTPCMTALLFLGPVLYPISAVPKAYIKFIYLNPVTVPAEELRKLMIWDTPLDWSMIGIYYVVSLVILFLGAVVFKISKNYFADVL